MIAISGNEAPVSNPTPAGSWTALYEDLVAGIIHSMNNSVTVLGVSLELSSADDVQGDIAVLRHELAQLVNLIGLTSSLSSRSNRHEALELRGVLDLAVTIHSLSPAMRSIGCVVHVTGTVPPVRVPRTVLLRALLLMIDAAKRAPGHDVQSIVIEVSGDPDQVQVRAPAGTVVSPDAVALATSCGGMLVLQSGQAVLTLPSLASVRRAAAN